MHTDLSVVPLGVEVNKLDTHKHIKHSTSHTTHIRITQWLQRIMKCLQHWCEHEDTTHNVSGYGVELRKQCMRERIMKNLNGKRW